MSKTRRNELLLVLTAFIWGVAFVAQSEGGDIVGPFTFCLVRFFIGAVALTVVMKVLNKLGYEGKKPETKEEKRELLIAGCACGLCMFGQSAFQQLGLYLGTSAGKAGFITATYIVIVPILGIFLHKAFGWNIWIAVFLALVGLYFLCMNGSFTIETGDICVLACAFVCSCHILVIDHFTGKVDSVRLSRMQFIVAGIIAIVPVMIFEIFTANGQTMAMALYGNVSAKTTFMAWLSLFKNWNAWIALLYAGIMSSGVAYTLQIVGQEDVNPAIASLLMSLESVFAVLAGALLLAERLSVRELTGCGLIFAAVVLAQVEVKPKKKAE
ncbi:MAG: DMT family transporter [Dorea sp.]|nr:DMT family transporter [Dorea sp.]